MTHEPSKDIQAILDSANAEMRARRKWAVDLAIRKARGEVIPASERVWKRKRPFICPISGRVKREPGLTHGEGAEA